MAWIRWRGRTEVKWASIGWRGKDGKDHYWPADTTDPASAEVHRRRIAREMEGEKDAPDRADVPTLVDDFLAYLKTRKRAETTRATYRVQLLRVDRALGSIPLHRWTLRALENAMLRDRRPTTVRSEFVTVGTFLKWCERERHPAPAGLRSALLAAEKPTVRLSERDVLDPEQVRALVAVVKGTVLEPAVALAAWAGLSIGDIRALRWDEVRGLGSETPELRRWQGRRKTGERLWVPLSPACADVLLRHHHKGPLVCRLLKERATLDALDRATTKAGIPKRPGDGWHRLRHGFSSRLAALGYDVATIGAMLGHRRGSSVTLRYLHPIDSRMRQAARDVAG